MREKANSRSGPEKSIDFFGDVQLLNPLEQLSRSGVINEGQRSLADR